EHELVAHVPVPRKLGAGLDAGDDRTPVALGVLPDVLGPDPGLPLLPREVADRDDLRAGSGHCRHGVSSDGSIRGLPCYRLGMSAVLDGPFPSPRWEWS